MRVKVIYKNGKEQQYNGVTVNLRQNNIDGWLQILGGSYECIPLKVLATVRIEEDEK